MQLGFVGLGQMGSRMARRLLEAGHDLVVHDIDATAVADLCARGATAVSSVKDVGDQADLVLTSLPTPAVVRDVVLGESGLRAGTRITHLIELSTTGAPTSRSVAAELARLGVSAVDAPVSGGTRGAEAGTLAIMVACAEPEFDLVEPVLAALGRVIHVGTQPGLGQVMKLVNNYLAAAALATTSEAMVVGAKAGLDPRTMLEVLNAGSGRNSATQDKFPRSVLPGRFDSGFATGLMEKDLGLFADEATGNQVPLWIGSAVHQMWKQARDQMGCSADFTSIVRLVEGWGGVEVRDGKPGIRR